MVAVFVTFVNQVNGLLTLILTEQVYILIFIASGYQLLQSKELKVISEISEEIAYTRVIAITQYSLTAKMFSVMPQLVVDIFQLRIEFILLGFFCLVQILISHII